MKLDPRPFAVALLALLLAVPAAAPARAQAFTGRGREWSARDAIVTDGKDALE